MLTPTQRDAIRQQLFALDWTRAYAIIDGASVPGLLRQFAIEEPEHVCLFSGELAPDVAAAAPYLVALDSVSGFTDWLIEQGWGLHWGVFCVADGESTFRALRNHLRTFLMVRRYDGKSLYFRYYDPRVLRNYLPTCTAAELAYVFGPIVRFLIESKDGRSILSFTADGAQTDAPVPTSVQAA